MSIYKKVSLGFLFVICSLLTISSFAQSDTRTHFIYIQSDGQQPFYVILNSKTYSSSSVGYLIISKLKDGKYNITIGFPQDKYPAKTYLCNIAGTDAGYRLKKTGDIWSVVNRQTGETLAVVEDGSQQTAATETTTPSDKSDNNASFGALLAKTSNDTTNYKAIADAKKAKAVMAEKSTGLDTSKPVTEGRVSNEIIKNKERAITRVNNAKPTFKESDYTAEDNQEKTVVDSDVRSMIKTQERKDRRGISLEFVSTSANNTDTITAFIPSDEATTSNEVASTNNIEKSDVAANTNNNNTTSDAKNDSSNPFYKGTTKKTATSNDNLAAFSDDESKSEESTKKEVVKTKDKSVTTASGNEIFNSTCTDQLSDKDLDKIKKKMIAKNSDDEMILVARKAIDTKCVYTAQIKQLGDLLLSDASRFSLYRLLYPNVYDGGQYKSLESQLLDKNYKSQFEALINKN
ncbi:DUF4476 domain-containing protein [Rhizosphaericola mali]|uniref:DUF4476 domain-containing protein n=1 Tax=Rhizosphaericola mali TaxID=2545455 RepID=A0A5P2G466_9BACT|nr:DUF4476 domain-containing protein [Rhizosphaericola mali]QES89488.1 DUF4476 domain-containing protein [Rhizosphaericola mali]